MRLECHAYAMADASLVGVVVGITTVALVGLVALGLSYGSFLARSRQGYKVGQEPVPSQCEIEQELRARLGRPPSLMEVAAQQQIYVNRRNQGLMDAALGAASLAALARTREKYPSDR